MGDVVSPLGDWLGESVTPLGACVRELGAYVSPVSVGARDGASVVSLGERVGSLLGAALGAALPMVGVSVGLEGA